MYTKHISDQCLYFLQTNVHIIFQCLLDLFISLLISPLFLFTWVLKDYKYSSHTQCKQESVPLLYSIFNACKHCANKSMHIFFKFTIFKKQAHPVIHDIKPSPFLFNDHTHYPPTPPLTLKCNVILEIWLATFWWHK